MKVLVMRFEIYLIASLPYGKVFHSSFICTLYKMWNLYEIVSFVVFVVFTTVSSRLEEECLLDGNYLINIYLIK